MNGKQLYLCLIEFKGPLDNERHRFMTAAIASSEEEAKQIAIDEARSEYPEHAPLPLEISAYSFRRSLLERAATEVLGWKPPA